MPTTTSFPPEIFAALTPAPYLLKHLTAPASKHNQHASSSPLRANGRTATQSRAPVLTTNSLTHGAGSAVVRTGDTAVVCGVRAEVLMARDVADNQAAKSLGASRAADGTGDDVMARLNLLVPNVELATGCSPAFLPGQAPSALAQSLAYRLLALLRTTRVVALDDLEIIYTPPNVQSPSSGSDSSSDSDDSMSNADDANDDANEAPPAQVIAYWTLYIDITLISLDGNPFDASWAALLAALQNTTLPRAWYDADTERVLCSSARSEATSLRVRGRPFAATFAVFEPDEGARGVGRAQPRGWILADPDEFEEGVSAESVTVVVDCSGGSDEDEDEDEDDLATSRVLSIEKSGGGFIGRREMRDVLSLAAARWAEWNAVVGDAE
jgi:exosome complex component RRP43